MKALLARIVFLAAALAAIPSTAPQASAEPTNYYQMLQGDYWFLLDTGERRRGHLQEIEEDGFSLREDRGITRFIPRQRVDRIHFPGAEVEELTHDLLLDGNLPEARRALRALTLQREAFLPWLTEEQLWPFRQFVPVLLQLEEPDEAISMVGMLRPFLSDPEEIQHMDEQILLAQFQLGNDEFVQREALEHVNRNGPYAPSMLGYYLLIERHLRFSEYEEALWLALQPILFSHQIIPDWLPEIYTRAIQAALALEDDFQVLTLFVEMEERGLPWPEDPATKLINQQAIDILRAWKAQQEKLAAPEESEDGEEPSGPSPFDEEPKKSPEQDLNLPLETVRRLLR